MSMFRVYVFTILVLLSSCFSDSCRDAPNVPLSGKTPSLERLDIELFSEGRELNKTLAFLENNPQISRFMLLSDQYPELSILARKVNGLINDPYIDTLYRQSVQSFETEEAVFLDKLSVGLDYLQFYFPEAKRPKIQTIVTGLFQDLYISDSLIVIGIDFFIGEETKYKPVEIPDYIFKRYNYNYLPSTIMGYLTLDYVKEGSENSLLSEMIDFGKIYYLNAALLPCVPEHEIIGFTEEEMKDVYKFQEIIWASLIENEVLYETSDFTKKKFLGERPSVYEIGEKCPGRVGAWVGWQIVNSFMDKQNMEMREMLAFENHHKLFESSGYKPKKNQ
jgi:hypothetical protein